MSSTNFEIKLDNGTMVQKMMLLPQSSRDPGLIVKSSAVSVKFALWLFGLPQDLQFSPHPKKQTDEFAAQETTEAGIWGNKRTGGGTQRVR